jgi:hypothetical protein
VIGAIIYLDNNGFTVWFLDSTTHEHSKYSTLVVCYTDTREGRMS